jgi:hypothetical protein
LIADNLSFFSDEEDGWNIEKGMAELGQNVNVVNNDNVLELSVEDIYGKESLEKALAEAENNIKLQKRLKSSRSGSMI